MQSRRCRLPAWHVAAVLGELALALGAGALPVALLIALSAAPARAQVVACYEEAEVVMSPPASPTAGFNSNDMGVWDPVRNVFVYGRGRISPDTPLASTYFETWMFNGSAWALVDTTIAIGDMTYSPWAYDSDRQRIMMFGGLRYAPCCGGGTGPVSLSDELWEFDGTTWTRETTMFNTPAARYDHALAYDPVRKRLVMYGGTLALPSAGQGDCAETWEYNPGTHAWVQRGVTPMSWRLTNMLYAPSTQQMMLVTGAASGQHPRTQIYNASSGQWVDSADVPTDSPNSDMVLVYDSNRQKPFLAGGQSAHSQYLTIFLWNGSAWDTVYFQLTPHPAFATYAVTRGAAAYDPLRRRVMNYGQLFYNDNADGFSMAWDGIAGIIQQPSSPSILCAGQDIALGVVGFNAEGYQWRRNGTPIPGATAPSFLKSNITVADEGVYDCALLTECGAAITNPVQISIATPPVFTAPSAWSGCSTCPGETLTVIPAQVADPRLQTIVLQKRIGITWTDVQSVEPLTSPFTISPLARSDAGEYRVIFRSACGEFVESTRTVEVGVAFDNSPMTQVVNPCSGVTLSVQARGTCIQSYQWHKNGAPLISDGRILGTSGPALTISGARFEDEGTYFCRVTDVCETRDSSAADLSLTSPVWVERTMNAAPAVSGSEYWASAYDEHRKVFVLYGGNTQSGQNSNALWEYDGYAWTARQPGFPMVTTTSGQFLYDGTYPPNNPACAMVYNPDDHKVYLIGPYAAAYPMAISTWDGASWARPYYGPVSGDTTRTHAVFDPVNHRIVIVRAVGGSNNSELLVYDPATSSMSGPFAMQPVVQVGAHDSALWFDAKRGRVIWYNNLNDFVAPTMWSLDADNSWTQLAGNPPRLPYATTVAYDPVRFQALGIGGLAGSSTYFTGTQVWPGLATKPWMTTMPPANDWAQVLPNGPPANSAGAGLSPPNNWRPAFWSGMSFDTNRRAMVAAGRSVETPFGYVWHTYERRYLDRVVFDLPIRRTIEPGNTVRFTSFAAGWPPAAGLGYRWKRHGVLLNNGPSPGGGTISGALGPVLQIAGAGPQDEGAYVCVVTNACGTADSLPASYGCPADFDHIDGLTVQDIFEFLNAWLASNPQADFNGVNGLEVQDIFDFLNAWFAGC